MCQHTASWSSCTQVPGHRLSFTYLSQGVSLYPSTADGGDFCWAYFMHHGTHLNLETELPPVPESFPQEEGAHQQQASNQQQAATTERSISGMTVALAGGSACSSKVPREQEAAVTPPAPSSGAGRCSWERATFSSNCINLGTAHMCCEAKGRMGPRRGASAFRPSAGHQVTAKPCWHLCPRQAQAGTTAFPTAVQLIPFWSIVLLQSGLSRQALFCSRPTRAHGLWHFVAFNNLCL